MRRRVRHLAAAAIAAAALMMVTSLAMASIPGPGGVLHACYDKAGNVRIIDSAASCSKGWRPVDIASQAGLTDEASAREAGDADTLAAAGGYTDQVIENAIGQAQSVVRWNASNLYPNAFATLTREQPLVAFPLALPGAGDYVLIAAGSAELTAGTGLTTAGCTWGGPDGDTYGGDGSYAAVSLSPDVPLEPLSAIWMAHVGGAGLVHFYCELPALGTDSGNPAAADAEVHVWGLTLSAIKVGQIDGPAGE